MVMLVLVLSSCTQNHGNIGRLFGSWHLYAMTEDGTTVDIESHGDTFWSFQSSLIMVTTEYDHYTVEKSYGTWMETDDALILDFGYSYDDPNSVQAYDPPIWMGLPKASDIVLTYLEKSDKAMSLRYVDTDGKTFEYFLRKTY